MVENKTAFDNINPVNLSKCFISFCTEKDKKSKQKEKDKKKKKEAKDKKKGPDRKLKPNPKIKVLEKDPFFESK